MKLDIIDTEEDRIKKIIPWLTYTDIDELIEYLHKNRIYIFER